MDRGRDEAAALLSRIAGPVQARIEIDEIRESLTDRGTTPGELWKPRLRKVMIIGPVFWTLVPEIFPNNIRGTAMIVPVLTQWAANVVMVLIFPVAFHQAGREVTFAFLALMALAQALFTWRMVPETKNKTLEEIELYLKHLKQPPAQKSNH